MTITGRAGNVPSLVRADLVEDVVLPLPLPEDDLELLGREDGLLVLEDVLNRDPWTRGVHPCIDTVSHEEFRRHEIHEEDCRPAFVLLREGLEACREAPPVLPDLLRHDDSERLRVPGPRDRGVPLPEDPVPYLPQVPGLPPLRVRDDHGFVRDEDRDPEGREVPGPDVPVAVDLLLDHRRGVVIAPSELSRL